MQEYQYDNNQTNNNFAFQANNVDNTGTPTVSHSSQPVYNQESITVNNENTTNDLFKRIMGSGLIAISAIIAICLLGSSLIGIMEKADTTDVDDSHYDTMIDDIEARHNSYSELDVYFDAGLIDEMYSRYEELRGKTTFYSYSRQDFLFCYDDYQNANYYYDYYVDRTYDSSYYLSSFLYYNLYFINVSGNYSYETLDLQEKEIIDEKIAEVRERTKQELGMDDDELDAFIETFLSEDSHYVDYSKVSDYAKTVYGE